MGAWMDGCGKLTTRDYVIDGATKPEALHNRIHEIRTRLEVLKRHAEVAYRKGRAEGSDEGPLRQERDAAWTLLEEEFGFVARCNVGAEAMTEADAERLRQIARRAWTRTLDDSLGLSNAELHARAPAVSARPRRCSRDRGRPPREDGRSRLSARAGCNGPERQCAQHRNRGCLRGADGTRPSIQDRPQRRRGSRHHERPVCSTGDRCRSVRVVRRVWRVAGGSGPGG